MPRKLASNISIITVTLAFMIFFLYAVIQIYTLTLNEAKKSHQQQQMEMAKAVALGIDTYLHHIIEDMRLLNLISEIGPGNYSSLQSNIDNILAHYEKKMVASIFISDIEGNIRYFKGEIHPDWLRSFIAEQIPKLTKPGLLYSSWFSPVRPNSNNIIDSGISFAVIAPLYKNNKEKSDLTASHSRKLDGLIGYVIDFELLVNLFIEPLKLSQNDFAWIMDGNGRLIYHPKHRNMLLRTVENLSEDCIECHDSFDIQNRIIREPASFGEYKIGHEPTKVMAYMPIELQSEKWILVISTFLPQITANLRDNFRNFFILGIIILIAILSFGLTLYYLNTRRIRAEETTRQAEKMRVLQEHLNQSSKLASVGELVDTVAHEINTPVGIISAQADAISLQGEVAIRFTEEISIIKQQIRRISKYTRSLLGYSRRAIFAPEPNDIVELLDECLYLLGHRFRAGNIKVSKEIATSLPKILIDRGQMEQVFINILNNAADAIHDHGEIKIRVNMQSAKEPDRSARPQGIVIEFIDNGEGIAHKNIDKIFEAFFTSKRSNKGTGLGLYISKSIIQRHQGLITVSANKPTGSKFKVYLPFNESGSF